MFSLQMGLSEKGEELTDKKVSGAGVGLDFLCLLYLLLKS